MRAATHLVASASLLSLAIEPFSSEPQVLDAGRKDGACACELFAFLMRMRADM
jgi:hypothetical protein